MALERTFFVTSVRGSDFAPQMAAKAGLKVFLAKMTSKMSVGIGPHALITWFTKSATSPSSAGSRRTTVTRAAILGGTKMGCYDTVKQWLRHHGWLALATAVWSARAIGSYFAFTAQFILLNNTAPLARQGRLQPWRAAAVLILGCD